MNSSSNAGNRPSDDERSVWLVLGGGALKGLAHVGVWRALQELRLPIAGVVGTSIGAIVGAGLLSGRPPDELGGIARSLRRRDIARMNPWLLLPFGVKQKSVFRGAVTRRFINDFLAGADWDDLRLPFCVNAVDLGTAEAVWFGHRGDTSLPLADAVYASSALPVLYPPLETGGRVLVDGGLLDTLPIHRAVEMGADEIIVVNAGADPDTDPESVLRRGLVGLNQRMFVIMSEQRRSEALARDHGIPVRLVRPALGHVDGFDFSRIDFFLEEGYRATIEALGPRSESRGLESS